MSASFPQQLRKAISAAWHDEAQAHGSASATSLLARNLWTFIRESTPQQRRQRYGDMDYDWDHRVNTTSGSVGWQARLLGLFHSPYQPTEPTLFHEMMASLPIEFEQFTFIDVGSGKGRTLLMASEYPFRKIVGIELIEELHRAAEENIRTYHSETQLCSNIEAICTDAVEFVFPETPLLLYLFNPLPEPGLVRLLGNLQHSLARGSHAAFVIYHNPQLAKCLNDAAWLQLFQQTHQFTVFSHK